MAERAGGARARLARGKRGGAWVRDLERLRVLLSAVHVTVRRGLCDIVMLSSCALSEGGSGVRSFTFRSESHGIVFTAEIRTPTRVFRSLARSLWLAPTCIIAR